MKYTKQALSFEEQADLLLSRGLEAERGDLIKRLKATSYFRLSGYFYPFREEGGENYRPGTSLEQVWSLCAFDQRLRTLLLDAVEAIEVFTRTQLAYHFAHDFGPFAYNQPGNLPNLKPDQFLTWQRKLDDQVQRSLRSHEEFVVHFFRRYGDEHTRLPIWVLVELMDFGSTLTFNRGINDTIKKRIAEVLGLPDVVVSSWLLTLNTIRNRCAHHSRLWNWTLGNPVLLPRARKYPEWHSPTLPNQHVGIVIILCRYLLNRISPSNPWTNRVNRLFTEYPNLSLSEIGLPNNWQDHPLWKS